MAEHLTWSVGNRLPSITENLVYSDGTAVNLSSSTVGFKMRAVGSSTLKVNSSAVIVAPPTAGTVRYDWAAIDVDTAGEFLVWWEVTTGGKAQDMPRGDRGVRGPRRSRINLPGARGGESRRWRSRLEHSDVDLQRAIVASSRVVDEMTQTRFLHHGRRRGSLLLARRRPSPLRRRNLHADRARHRHGRRHDIRHRVDAQHRLRSPARERYRGGRPVPAVGSHPPTPEKRQAVSGLPQVGAGDRQVRLGDMP